MNIDFANFKFLRTPGMYNYDSSLKMGLLGKDFDSDDVRAKE